VGVGTRGRYLLTVKQESELVEWVKMMAEKYVAVSKSVVKKVRQLFHCSLRFFLGHELFSYHCRSESQDYSELRAHSFE